MTARSAAPGHLSLRGGGYQLRHGRRALQVAVTTSRAAIHHIHNAELFFGAAARYKGTTCGM